MRATRGMNVMIAGIPSHPSWIDPPLQMERDLHGGLLHDEPLVLLSVFGAARVFDQVLAGRKQDILAVRPVDLRMEREVRRQALGLRGVYALLAITNQERTRGRPVIGAAHTKG